MTRFLETAQAHDCRILPGLGMLVAQAVISIELWTGVSVDPAVMEEKLRQIFSTEG
jgi:shikimate 5-dehydrogenase